MKHILPFFLILLSLGVIFYHSSSDGKKNQKSSKEQSIRAALEYFQEITKDPALGYPPQERLIRAIRETRRLQQLYALRNSGGILESEWMERGPNNIGGRTRAILIDANDPSGNTVFTGGVAGGLWKTEDISASTVKWVKVNDYLDNLAVGALAQDPSNPQLLYMGTGEGFNNIDAHAGLGIFRSRNGGADWELLENTLNPSFQFCQGLFVHPQTGDVYSATKRGLWRSQDEGLNWEKVLGFGAGTSIGREMIFDIVYHRASNTFFASNAVAVFKSNSGNRGSWEDISTGYEFLTGLSRVELAVGQGTPYKLYAVGNSGGQGSAIYHLQDGQGLWVAGTEPEGGWASNQAWYDLDIAVDPFNGNRIIAGGLHLYTSGNAGLTWQRISNTGVPQKSVHVDQHYILYDEKREGRVFFGNDGGIYLSENGGATFRHRNSGYNVTQFYACALHPEALKDYILGGTQDNGSLQLNRFGIDNARNVWGGDGFYAHIDQDEPHIQLVASQFGNVGRSNDGGSSFGPAVDTEGSFITPSDYDNDANIYYGQTNAGQLFRWNLNTNVSGQVAIEGFALEGNQVSHIYADPNVPNRLYVGGRFAELYRIDNADGEELTAVSVRPSNAGYIASVEAEPGNENHLLATISSYGVKSVFETFDGGENWVSVEGNLPDMPVHWGIFNPNDPTQAILGTELGVWATDKLNGEDTEWVPPTPGIGTPLTRVSMLQWRQSDKVVLASTHGRGMWATDVFATPLPVIDGDQVHYTGSPVNLRGERSLNAQSFRWELGDGTVSNEENPTHSYSSTGEYNIRLTINGEHSEEATMRILPDRGLPYASEAEAYSGGFEAHPEQFAVHTISGSSFERGRSSISGKNGVNTGDNAFVLGLEEEFYQPNTHTVLYLPNFDFSDQGIYEFSFWAKYRLDPGLDGFQVQYSTNRGQNWQQLGSDQDKNWYNYRNDNELAAAFEPGTSYFSANKLSFSKFSLNISDLGGNENVAFRFVFKSEGTGNYPGLAIDDVKITKFAGELRTNLLKFSGEFAAPTEIRLDWTTEPEYHCKYFELERSENGKSWEVVDKINSTGGITTELQSYTYNTLAQRNLYFYRLRVFNEAPSIDYLEEFYSPTIAIRRDNFFQNTQVLRVLPNPFRGFIEATFTDVLDGDKAFYELYDASGRKMREGVQEVSGPLMRIESLNVPTGVYFLNLVIGEEGKPQAFKLLAY